MFKLLRSHLSFSNDLIVILWFAMDSCGERNSQQNGSNPIFLQPICHSFHKSVKKRSSSFDDCRPPLELLSLCRSVGDVRSSEEFTQFPVKTSALSTRSESSLSEYYSLETLVNESAPLSDLDDTVSESIASSPANFEDTTSIYEDLSEFPNEMSDTASKTSVTSQPSSAPSEKKKGIRLSFRKKKTPKVPVVDAHNQAENVNSSPEEVVGPDKTSPNSPNDDKEVLGDSAETGSKKISGHSYYGEVDGDPSSEKSGLPINENERNIDENLDSRSQNEKGFGVTASEDTFSKPKFFLAENDKSQDPVSKAEKVEATQHVENKAHLMSKSTTSNIQAGSNNVKKEHLYKILVIGELGAGKTSIIKRYVHQFFSQHYRATIGVDFALKVLNWDDDTVVRLQLWDIAGQERFGNMTRVYYKEAVGAFIVFDVTRSHTFDAILKWKTDLDSKVTLPNGGPIPVVLLANKCDQTKEGLVTKPNDMDQFCKENEITGWFETSAKDNINIEEASKFLVTKILRFEREGLMANDSLDASKFSVRSEHEVAAKKPKCAC